MTVALKFPLLPFDDFTRELADPTGDMAIIEALFRELDPDNIMKYEGGANMGARIRAPYKDPHPVLKRDRMIISPIKDVLRSNSNIVGAKGFAKDPAGGLFTLMHELGHRQDKNLMESRLSAEVFADTYGMKKVTGLLGKDELTHAELSQSDIIKRLESPESAEYADYRHRKEKGLTEMAKPKKGAGREWSTPATKKAAKRAIQMLLRFAL